LGESDHAVVDAEQREDLEVLLALGHPALAGRDDEEGNVHCPHPGQHVLDEADVTGDVDEPDLGPRRQRRERETQVDGQPPRLLLGQTVRVGAGEGQHQRRLAVIDVARGREPSSPRHGGGRERVA